MGILVLAVQSGEVGRDGTTGRWVTRNRRTDKDIPDPLERARRCQQALWERLGFTKLWNRRDVVIGHGVVFPDCRASQVPALWDMPRDILATLEDMMSGRGQWVTRMFQYWAGLVPPMRAIDASTMTDLEQVFGRQWELRRPQDPAGQAESPAIKLTKEQSNVLDLLTRHRNVAVDGGVGTGKTLLALEMAWRLANDGFRTLLTCSNRALGEHLKASLHRADNLVVGSFPDVCRQYSGRVDRELSYWPLLFFSTPWLRAFTQSMHGHPDERFDAIIIDEEHEVTTDEVSLRTELGRVLEQLIGEEHVPPGDIAILTGRERSVSSLARVEKVGPWRLTTQQAKNPWCVLFESIRAFTGLERPVIILVEIDNQLDDHELLYLGATRAQSHLIILGSEATVDALQTG